MKSWFWLLIVCSYCSSGRAATDYRPGDIILLPVDCHACDAIELETGSPYAHAGLVVIESGKPIIIEAWSKVERTSLEDFLQRAKLGVSPLLIRAEELWLNYNSPARLAALNTKLIKIFESKYAGLAYDDDFLWNNVDEHGREKLYCSELITKLLNELLFQKVPTYKMTYSKARRFWSRYFQGVVPDGQPGNNPGSFMKSGLFFVVESIFP